MKKHIISYLSLSVVTLGALAAVVLSSNSKENNFKNNDEVIYLNKQNLIGEAVEDSMSKFASSKIFAFYDKLENENQSLRFATAITGDITSLSYTRAKVGEHNENVKEVATVYRGIIADSKTYFYDGNDLTTNEAYAGNYYWACYTISYTKDSSLIETPINLSLAINGEEKVTIQKALKELIHVAVTDIKLSNMNLYNNQIVFDLNNPTTQNLNATALPSNATLVNNITYEIEDTSIASVTDKGDITPVGEGKTTLTIKCDEIIKAVTIRVVKLDDSSLIKDSKETLEDIGDKNIPGWYAKPNSTYISVSMKDGTISCTSTKQMTKSLVAQFKYQPTNDNSGIYIGKYVIAFTIDNPTTFGLSFQCYLGNNSSTDSNITQELFVEKRTTNSFIFVFNSIEESNYLTIEQTKKIDIGTFTISNIHFIALSD